MTDNPYDTTIPCCNPHCQAVIGHYVVQDNKVWMKVGGLVLYAAHGVCTVCGTAYHWAVSDQDIRTLIERRAKIGGCNQS